MNRIWLCVRRMPGGARRWDRHSIAARSERGQGMLEYAIISGAIIVGTAAVLAGLSGSLNHIFSTISATLGQY